MAAGDATDAMRPGNNQTSSKARGYNFVEVVLGAPAVTSCKVVPQFVS